MDVPDKQGNYHYQNEDLGFELLLPGDFQYYITYRKKNEGFVDLAILVPTGDVDYQSDVPGYAQPVTIRVFEQQAWSDYKTSGNNAFQEISEKNGQVYTIKFWNGIPKDWENKWNKERIDFIKSNFKLL